MATFTEEQLKKAQMELTTGVPMWGEYGLNGHFWCEAPNGEVIDHWWKSYDDCRKTMGIQNKKLIYYPCTNPVTNAIMTKKVKTLIANMGGEEIIEHMFSEPRENKCMLNAMAQVKKTGGTLRFGSLALHTDDEVITCWLSGHEDFKTYADYTRKDMPLQWTIRDEKKAKKYAKKIAQFI